jgi:hypothetical protein
MNVPVAPEAPSRWFGAIKNPMLFDAFAIFAAFLTVSFAPASIERWCVLGFIAAVTIWLNGVALVRPRFLAYGASEYLAESKLQHERRMAQIE